jgi:hypothetical protein
MEVQPWDITVCGGCHASQRGGIVPALYPHLIEHLKARDLAPRPGNRTSAAGVSYSIGARLLRGIS